MYIFCGWYTFIMLILSTILTIAIDKETISKNTGGYKLTKILLNLPVLYFVAATLFK